MEQYGCYGWKWLRCSQATVDPCGNERLGEQRVLLNGDQLRALCQVSRAEWGNTRGYHAGSHWECSLGLRMRFLSVQCCLLGFSGVRCMCI